MKCDFTFLVNSTFNPTSDSHHASVLLTQSDRRNLAVAHVFEISAFHTHTLIQSQLLTVKQTNVLICTLTNDLCEVFCPP